MREWIIYYTNNEGLIKTIIIQSSSLLRAIELAVENHGILEHSIKNVNPYKI